MNKEKIEIAKKVFYNAYPLGFEDEKMVEIKKKHRIGKVHQFAIDALKKDSFSNTQNVLDNWVKLINKSSMVSLFEKPKFRDMIKILNPSEKEVIVKGLYEFLYGDLDLGFQLMLEVLEHYKLAKWTLITAAPYYLKPEEEVFIKPTTVKMAIEYFEFDCIKYKPKPTLEFYTEYKKEFLKLKKIVNVTNDNAAFGGFIMIATGL